MKVVLPSNQQKSLITPVIPLEKPERKLGKHEHAALKLRTNGADEHSPTREVLVPCFKDGTPEQLIDFLKDFKNVVNGHNLTNGPQKFASMRTLLEGEALSFWNHEASTVAPAETNATFDLMVRHLTVHVFPKKASRTQKRCIRRCLRKNPATLMRNHRTRVDELNDQLACCPNGKVDDNGAPQGFLDTQKLDKDELADVLEFGAPNSWQKRMIAQGFDSLEEEDPVQALVEFCERIETVEGMEGNLHPRGKKPPRTVDTQKRSRTSASSVEAECGYDATKRCDCHGVGHDNNSCKVLKSIATELKDGKKAGRRPACRSKTCVRPDQAERNKKDTAKQLRALVEQQGQMIAALMDDKSGSSRKRKGTSHLNALQGKKDDPPAADEASSESDGEECNALQAKLEEFSISGNEDGSDADDQE